MRVAARLRSFVVILALGWSAQTEAQPALRAQVYASGFSQPVAFVQDPSDRSVQFIVEQAGRIRVIQNGSVLATDFLDLRGAVSSGGERGLLGMAFAPDSPTSGRLFVNFTNPAGNTVVARFRRSADPLVADAASRFDFHWGGAAGPAFIAQPFANHNGGNLAFGPDGFLYIGLGDGGSGDDPGNRAQTPSELLGKMLRIDVNVPDSDPIGYRVPSSNPFLNDGPAGTRPEIWSFGLRNPWRYTFDDPARGGSGALLIADVGQNRYEEIDYEPANFGGRNYGWRYREGAHDNITSLPPAFLPLTEPIFEYDHSVGQSITGGYVYRGHLLGGAYRGRYFYADFIQGRVWSIALAIDPSTGNATASGLIEHTADLGGPTLGNISSFGVDADGELYIVSYSRGMVLKVLGLNQPVDFDDDVKSEIAVYRPSNGAWFIRQSYSAFGVSDFLNYQWGLPGDLPTPGDFDGDGRTDIVVYRPATGEWYVRVSSTAYGTYSVYQWGLAGDVPLVADFDGDGKAELTVYRPSTGQWFIRYSSLGYAIAGQFGLYQWGLDGDKPIVADFDGDGKADITIYRPSTGEWFIRYSSHGYSTSTFGLYQWGLTGDTPIGADFDGDGKTDITVYRPSTGEWFIRYSSRGFVIAGRFGHYQWGQSGDMPLALDFDGDGRTELTVYRPSTGEWFIRYSTLGYAIANAYGQYQWGLAGDTPLPSLGQ